MSLQRITRGVIHPVVALLLASIFLSAFPIAASADEATPANEPVSYTVVPTIDRAFGGYSDRIVWRTLDGSSSGYVTLDDDIRAMTVDTDGTKIYVLLQSGEFQVFDSLTLEQQASFPIDVGLNSMTATGGIVTSSTCNWWETGTTIDQFDIDDPDNVRSSWTPQQECPPMFVDSSDPDVVFLGTSYPWETVTKVDISTEDATELAQYESTNVGQGTMTASGDALFFVANGVVVELDPSDLSVVDTYDPPGTDYISDVAVTSDGAYLVAATGTAAYSFARGAPDPVATWPYRVDSLLGGDASNVYGSDWGMLLRLDDVDQARDAAAISVQAPAGPAADGDQVTFTGSLTAAGLDPTKASVRLFRWGPEGEDGYSLTELGSGTPDGDGDFSIEATIVDQPDPTSNYLVYWEGDADHTSALSKTMFTSSKRLSSITVQASTTSHAAMQPVTATGQLTFDDEADASGQPITLSYGQEPVELVTGTNGTFSYQYQRGATDLESSYDLEATFEGTHRYSASTAEQSMSIYKVAAPLSLSVDPSPAKWGGTATVTAHLDEWTGDGHVEIFDQGINDSDWTLVDEGDVSVSGNLSAEIETTTNRRFKAVYAGDQEFLATEKTKELEVEVIVKEKMLRSKRKQHGVYLYKPNGTAVYGVTVVAPDKEGNWMSMVLQAKSGHGWKTKVSEDFKIPANNTVAVAIPMRYLRDQTYRIYGYTQGTAENAYTRSEPAVFRKL